MIELGQNGISDSSSRNNDLAQGAEMEVLCSCDEPYLPHTATMLCSLLEHNNNVSRIHLFYQAIPNRELAKLQSLTARYGSVLTCYEVAADDLENFSSQPYWSIACYFRLLAARILPTNVKKILYLDSDMIVRRSLKDLWSTNLSDRAFAAVEDAFWDPRLSHYVKLPAGAKYFNSGVLLINLDYWRRNKLYEWVIEFARDNPEKMHHADQDALNAILVDRWINLPAVWNDHAQCVSQVPAVRNKNITDPAIVHFLGAFKPWSWSCEHPFKSEYHKYRLKTPWRRYREEGKPHYRLLRGVARRILPGSLRQWLRSHILGSQA
jgi:lipopolysaccharide biosynthesis glycosyltransferase